MVIKKLVVGPIQTNCYLVADDTAQGKPTAIIDPGEDAPHIVSLLRRDGLTPACILLTHGHPDHVTAIPALLEEYPDLPVYIHKADEALAVNGDAFSNGGIGSLPFRYYAQGDAVTWGSVTAKVLETPGHTPGSVCLQVGEGHVFTGDTLFQGSCGRTDFPGGSMADMMRSLAGLSKAAPRSAVYPGHGPATTMEQELLSNYYMIEALRKA